MNGIDAFTTFREHMISGKLLKIDAINLDELDLISFQWVSRIDLCSFFNHIICVSVCIEFHYICVVLIKMKIAQINRFKHNHNYYWQIRIKHMILLILCVRSTLTYIIKMWIKHKFAKKQQLSISYTH